MSNEVNENSTETGQQSTFSKLKKPLILIAVLLILMFAARYFGLGKALENAKGFIDGLGPWGPIVFGLIYILTNILMIPGSALTIIGGGIFGGFWGTIIISISSTVGAACCFLIARYFARDSISAWVSQKPKFHELDKLTKTHGGWIVAITRLVPVFPFNLLNYGFGLTRVSFWTYVFFSWLCMLPGTVMYVVGADALSKALVSGEVPWMLLGILAFIIVFLTIIVRFARGKLNQAEQEANINQSEKDESPISGKEPSA